MAHNAGLCGCSPTDYAKDGRGLDLKRQEFAQGLAGVLYRGKVTGLKDYTSISDVVRPTVMLTCLRAYYEVNAEGMYQSHKHRVALSSVGALEKLLFSEM